MCTAFLPMCIHPLTRELYSCMCTWGCSTPHPCSSNTLTLSIMANTFFSSKGSIITMTGLTGAIAATGPIDLIDGPSTLGHHLYFAAEPFDIDPIDNRTKGRGFWNDANKTLTLYVAADTDCATEYVFGFVVTNPAEQQGPSRIAIQASWIADTTQTFIATDPPPSDVMIASSLFEHDMLRIPSNTPYADEGDAAGLRVWELRFEYHSINQTSAIPCALNTITVLFKTNVPLLKTTLCSPTVTISGGLAGAIGPAEGPMALFDVTPNTTSRFTSNTSNTTTQHSDWNNTEGHKSLVLSVRESTAAGVMYGLSFIVTNPAKFQACPTATITAQGCGDTSSSLGVSTVMNNGDQTKCAMKIEELIITHARIQQSSPFPCDNNTITSEFRFNLPVLSACAPRVTIRGLESAAAPASAGNISLTDLSSNGSAGVDTGFGTHALWTGSGVGAELRLEAAGDLSPDKTYSFSWVVTNPAWTNGSTEANATYQMTTSNVGLGSADTSTNTFELAEGTFVKVHAVAEPLIQGRSQAGVGFTAADAHPLFIRKPTLLVANISQSTPNPCAFNTISVSLKSNVPSLTSHGAGCAPEIVIAGLLNTGTFDHYLTISNVKANADVATEIVSSNASWTQAEGKLVLVFQNQTGKSMVFEAGPLYSLDFVVINPAQNQSSQPMTAQMWNGDVQDIDRGSGAAQPLAITEAVITLSNVTQSSSIPCEDSVITLTVAFNVPLLTSCAPTLTITGLQNSRIDPVSVENSQGVFRNTVGSNTTWNLSEGKLIFFALANVAAGPHVFNMTLRNPEYGQQERRVDINGAIFNLAHNQVPHTFDSSLNPLFTENSNCTETPANQWVDFEGNTCGDYAANASWCTTAVDRATVNTTVVRTSAPAYFVQGKSALDMCCTCVLAHSRVYAPLYVQEVALTSKIGQSSAYPCGIYTCT